MLTKLKINNRDLSFSTLHEGFWSRLWDQVCAQGHRKVLLILWAKLKSPVGNQILHQVVIQVKRPLREGVSLGAY